MRTTRRLVLGATVLALVVSACTSGEDGNGTAGDKPTITIGSAGFYESQLMAEIYAQALEANGYTIVRQLGIGPRTQTQPAIESGQIDLMPEYIGSLLTFLGGQASGDAQATAQGLRDTLAEKGLALGAYTPAQDTNAFAVRSETASQYDLSTLSDLAAVAGELVWGLPPECDTNALCAGVAEQAGGPRVGGLADYGIDYDSLQVEPLAPCDAPMAIALNEGAIDVAELCSTQPDIERFNFVVLEDDLQTQPAENLAPVVRDEKLVEAGDDLFSILDRVSAAMTTEELTSLGVRVAVDQEDIAVVAREWLEDNGLI